MAPLWKRLDAGLPIVTTEKNLYIQLEPSRPGVLRIRCSRGSFPQGALSLIVSNWPQTVHWCVPARLEGEVLTADMAGSEAAFDPEDNRPLCLALAQETERGLVLYPLRALRLLQRMKTAARSLYLYDNRDLFAGPVDSFCQDGRFFEAVPTYAVTGKKTVDLALRLVPRSLRYEMQMTYGLTRMEEREDCLWWQAAAPAGAPELLGLSLRPTDGNEGTGRFFPFTQRSGGRWACLPLSALPMDGREYVLSGVVEQEGDLLFHVPLCVIDSELHIRLEDRANGLPYLKNEDRACYVKLDELCHPSFVALPHRPSCQQNIPAARLDQALENGLLPETGHCAITDLGGRNWQWQMELHRFLLTNQDEVCIVASRQNQRCLLPVRLLSVTPSYSLLSADLSPMIDRIQTSRIAQWDLALAIHQGEDWYHMRLRCPARTVRRRLNTDREYLDYSAAFGSPMGEAPVGDHSVEGLLSCLTEGYCQLQLADPLYRYEPQIIARCDRASLHGTTLRLRLRCPAGIPGRWVGVMLVHRFKLEIDRSMRYFPASQLAERDGVFHMAAKIDLSPIALTPLYWDIRAVFEGEDGRQYLLRVVAATEQNRSDLHKGLKRRWLRLRRAVFTDSYRQGSDLSVSLYRTAGNGFALVCQDYSPYSGFRFRMKERIALILSRLFRKQLAKKSIFLCYEKYCCMAQDNGFYFFRHCMENGMERKMHRSIYFVIDKKQPDYKERLLPYKDHVIQFMSLRHMIYILAARLLISSDSKAHAYAWRAKESIILPRIQHNKKLVFLQHGVIALKRVEFYSKGTNAVQLFITSNQREHDIIVSEMAYPTEDVVITGLARWDVLEDKGLKERRILVMPTWRNWLEEVSDVVFTSSDYYRNYMSLLNDSRLFDLLERQDLYLDFYIHPKFREYISNFSITEGGRVRLIPFGTEPLNQLIMGCKLLITDYSSVCWDVYYQGKPVLFYQFDLEQYNETTGSYIDMETELFGDRVITPEELLNALEQYAESDFRLPEKYAEMRPHMYTYIDHNNSQRVCQEIMKRHW